MGDAPARSALVFSAIRVRRSRSSSGAQNILIDNSDACSLLFHGQKWSQVQHTSTTKVQSKSRVRVWVGDRRACCLQLSHTQVFISSQACCEDTAAHTQRATVTRTTRIFKGWQTCTQELCASMYLWREQYRYLGGAIQQRPSVYTSVDRPITSSDVLVNAKGQRYVVKDMCNPCVFITYSSRN